MDIDHLLEMVKKLDSKKKGRKDEIQRLQRLFERFHLVNRKYLDKETFEKARESMTSMTEAIANTLRFLDDEIARLRSKRMKLPFDNIELNEMQKVQARNEMLLKEHLASLEE
jgi:hypothetical protein